MCKNILFISEHGDPLAKLGGKQSGGQNNYVKQLACALADRGINVDVVTHWSEKNVPQIERFGESCRVIRIGAGQKGFIPKSQMLRLLPAFLREMETILPIEKYDIIHTHYWMSGLLGLELRAKYGVPVVHTSHSLAIAKENATGKREEVRLKAEQYILQEADRVIATTHTEKNVIHGFAGKSASVTVVPIGVDQAFERAQKQVKNNIPRFVYAGRFEETKGILTLLRAFRTLIRNGGKAHLIVAGGGQDEIDANTGLPTNKEYRETVKNFENFVKFYGPLSQQDLADEFAKATAVIVPSYYESFGMVAAEAQACGTPVIASKVGGLQDVVQDGRTGILVPPKNSKDFAYGLKVLASNPKLTRQLGKQAEERAREVFNWKVIAKDIHKNFEEVYRAEDPAFIGY